MPPSRAQAPAVVGMTANGATLLLPRVEVHQDAEVQYGYMLKGSWKLANVVERFSG